MIDNRNLLAAYTWKGRACTCVVETRVSSGRCGDHAIAPPSLCGCIMHDHNIHHVGTAHGIIYIIYDNPVLSQLVAMENMQGMSWRCAGTSAQGTTGAMAGAHLLNQPPAALEAKVLGAVQLKTDGCVNASIPLCHAKCTGIMEYQPQGHWGLHGGMVHAWHQTAWYISTCDVLMWDVLMWDVGCGVCDCECQYGCECPVDKAVAQLTTSTHHACKLMLAWSSCTASQQARYCCVVRRET